MNKKMAFLVILLVVFLSFTIHAAEKKDKGFLNKIKLEPTTLKEKNSTVELAARMRAEPQSECDTLFYHTEPLYYWPIPDQFEDDFFNERFVMPFDGYLSKIRIAFYGEGSSGTPDAHVYVWESDGTFPMDPAPPAGALEEFVIPNDSINWSGWTEVDIEIVQLELTSAQPFHIGYSHPQNPGDTLSILSDDGNSGSQRSIEYRNGAWSTILNDWGLDADFFIQAVVCPDTVEGCCQFLSGCASPITEQECLDMGGEFIPHAVCNIETGECEFPTNNPPVLDPVGSHKFNEGDYVVLNLDALDLDGDSLAFSASNLPTGAEFDSALGVFLWTPSFTQQGTYPGIHFEVSDGRGGVDYEDITMEILNYPKGDVNGDGIINSADVVYLVNYLFISGPAPDPLEAGDVNCDELVNSADIIYLINYLFINGPVPCAPPSPRFILPKSNAPVNGLVWVSVQNLSDTPVQAVEFEYSADSLIWNQLVFDERQPPGSPGNYDLTGKRQQGSWNTDDLASGPYWIRVTMTDSVHNLQGSETIPVVLDKDPIPVIGISYDTLTHTVTLDASSSYDPEGSVIWWEWIFCDTTTGQGSVISKDFAPGDFCQVNLTIYDDAYNSSSSYDLLEIGEQEANVEPVESCICLSLNVVATGEIPEGSRLDFGNTNSPNPRGGKVLGPVDHHEQDAKGNDIPLGPVQLYFMVEAEVRGNPEACSTMQYNNFTFLYDGPGGPGPNEMRVFHNGGEPFDPANPNNPQDPPDNAADLDPDDYNTDCGPSDDRPTGPLEKVAVAGGGIIRWIDAPGLISLDPEHFDPEGTQVFDFKMFEVIDYPACDTGCEQCIIWKAAYDEDEDREDVDGDNNPDPPKITDANADCP